MPSVHRWFLPLAAALALAAPVSAQWKPVSDAGPVRTITAASAITSGGSDFGLTRGSRSSALESAAPTFVVPPFPGEVRAGEDVAMMIVGGAALVVGSVIGGDAGTLMMVGGGVVGLVGLYRYLR